MKMPLRHWHLWAAIGLLVVVITVALFPLRIAVAIADNDGRFLQAREVGGIIWYGRMADVRVRGFPIGTVDSRLAFWPLFRGRAQFILNRKAESNQPALRIKLARGNDFFEIKDATGLVQFGDLSGSLPIQSLEFNKLSVAFSGKRCVTAGGQIRVVPDPIVPELDLRQGMLGQARCEKDQLIIPLSGQSGMEKLELRVAGDGKYQARLLLLGDRSQLAPILNAAGFRSVAGGYAQTISGQF